MQEKKLRRRRKKELTIKISVIAMLILIRESSISGWFCSLRCVSKMSLTGYLRFHLLIQLNVLKLLMYYIVCEPSIDSDYHNHNNHYNCWQVETLPIKLNVYAFCQICFLITITCLIDKISTGRQAEKAG